MGSEVTRGADDSETVESTFKGRGAVTVKQPRMRRFKPKDHSALTACCISLQNCAKYGKFAGLLGCSQRICHSSPKRCYWSTQLAQPARIWVRGARSVGYSPLGQCYISSSPPNPSVVVS